MGGVVFISYAHQDEIFVRTLARRLREVGLEPWHYTASERRGDDYTARLIAAIEQAAAVVVIVSSGSTHSLPVLQEILHARFHRRRIIPLELEPCDGPVPYHLRPYFRINGWDRRNVAPEILRAVEGQSEATADWPQDEATLKVLPPFHSQASRETVILQAPADYVPASLPAEVALCMVGRDPRHTLSFLGSHVSRTHARISLRIAMEGVGYVIHDLESTRGTFVNGKRISIPQPLHNGDQIGFGTTEAMVLFVQLDPTAPSPSTHVLPDE